MKKTKLFVVLIMPISFLILSCSSTSKQKNVDEEINIRAKVDNQTEILKSSINDFVYVLSIDHARLAQEAGVYTPPAIVTLFSNPKVNTHLIDLNPLTGLDLPYKVLSYSEPDTTDASIAYTSSAFLQKRHGIQANDLHEFDQDMSRVLENFSESRIASTNFDSVGLNYGIIQLNSDYDFGTTVQRLKAVIDAQSDTKWFGEIDFQKEARDINMEIGKTTLLLFGGPAPGGQAMFNSPRLGLDAFCQKLLVFENEKKQVIVAFNDIPAFAKLYYSRITKPQELINSRLKTTFEKAVSTNK